jgi:hypothetical protein
LQPVPTAHSSWQLKSLSESAGTHRHSFVRQLESAFRTPVKNGLDGFSHPRLEEDVHPIPANAILSDGYCLLNKSSDPNTEKPAENHSRHHIIPSSAFARSLSMTSIKEDGFALQSTTSQARSAPGHSAHCRVDSDSSSKRSMHRDSQGDVGSLHSCASSQTSFRDLESFDEVHHGFEFVENRPACYPPPSFIHRHNPLRRDSILSIASVSLYGIVINPGVEDPFEYGYWSQPASCDMSAFVTMSTWFIRRAPHRKRVDNWSGLFQQPLWYVLLACITVVSASVLIFKWLLCQSFAFQNRLGFKCRFSLRSAVG